jgi:hypothetical protein
MFFLYPFFLLFMQLRHISLENLLLTGDTAMAHSLGRL